MIFVIYSVFGTWIDLAGTWLSTTGEPRREGRRRPTVANANAHGASRALIIAAHDPGSWTAALKVAARVSGVVPLACERAAVEL